MANAHFERLAVECGLSFHALGTIPEYEAMLRLAGLFHPLRSATTLGALVYQSMPKEYDAIFAHHEPGSTVLVASGAMFGARIAQEVLGIPLITIILQPVLLRSVHDPPVLSALPRIPRWLPLAARRALFRIVDAAADRAFHASGVNAFRSKFGLSKVKKLLKDWWLSPSRTVGLFPEWYGPPMEDWPTQLRLTSFPLYDERKDGEELTDVIASDLKQNGPPIVVTPGSGMIQGHWFFETMMESCLRLNRRAFFLTRYREQLPRKLPALVQCMDYVPFSQLLPHAAALVHPGGIGSASQAMAAGIPQLVVPLVNDQPDNARRIKRLGIGDWVSRRNFRAKTVSEKLADLLRSQPVADACRMTAEKLRPRDGIANAVALIEESTALA